MGLPLPGEHLGFDLIGVVVDHGGVEPPQVEGLDWAEVILHVVSSEVLEIPGMCL